MAERRPLPRPWISLTSLTREQSLKRSPPRGIPDWTSSTMGFSQHDERSRGTGASERSRSRSCGRVGKGIRGWSDSESEMGGKYQLKRHVTVPGAASSFRRKTKAQGGRSTTRKAQESAPKENTAEGDVKTDAKDKEVLIDISKDNPGVGDEPIDISSSTESSPAALDRGGIASVGGGFLGAHAQGRRWSRPANRVCQGRWWPQTNAFWAGVAAYQKLAHQRLIEKTTALPNRRQIDEKLLMLLTTKGSSNVLQKGSSP